MTGFTCFCMPGYSGNLCKKTGDACQPGVCGDNGQCLNTAIGYKCLCPYGKAGQNCENNIQIEIPYFSSDSYLAFGINKSVLKAMNMMFKFKAEDVKDGLLVIEFLEKLKSEKTQDCNSYRCMLLEAKMLMEIL